MTPAGVAGAYRPLLALGFLGLVAAVAALAWHAGLSLETVAARELELRAAIAGRPVSAFVAAVAAYALISMLPGTGGKAVVAGWLFGLWQGTLIVVIGLVVAGVASFWISRTCFRDAVETRFASLVKVLNTAMKRDGAIYLLTLQLTSIPWSLLNWVCGVIRIRLWTFVWTMVLGVLPGTLILVNLGTSLPTLHTLLEHGTRSLLDPSLVIALGALAALPLTIRYAVRLAARTLRPPPRGGPGGSRRARAQELP